MAVLETVFIAVWIAFFLACALVFVFGSPSLKRKVHAPATILAGLLFAGFAGLIVSSSGLWIVLPGVVLITFLNIYSVAFCAKCGHMNRNAFVFPRPEFCNRCGSHVDYSGSSGSNS